MEPISMADEWGGREELAACTLAEEHASKDVPTETVTLVRSFPTYTETMYVRGYPSAKAIVITCPPVTAHLMNADGSGAIPYEMPGTVRDLPVGWRDMASAKAFRARVERTVHSYLDQGWERA